MTSRLLSQHFPLKHFPFTGRLHSRLAPLGGATLLAALGIASGRPAQAQGLVSGNTSFATAANFYFSSGSTVPNLGNGLGSAMLGDTRFFKFLVTSPGNVDLELIGGSSSRDRGPISLYDANQNPLQTLSSGGLTGSLADGFYYTSFNVTVATFSPGDPGNNLYNFQIAGSGSGIIPPPTASVAPAGAPPAAVPEPGTLSLLGLGLGGVVLAARRRRRE